MVSIPMVVKFRFNDKRLRYARGLSIALRIGNNEIFLGDSNT